MNRTSIQLAALVAVTALGTMCASARGQIYVSSYGANPFAPNGLVGEYSTSGPVNASLVSGLTFPTGIAVSGANLFVTEEFQGSGNSVIGEYTLSGTPVNTSLFTGLASATGIAAVGSNLFVVNYFDPNSSSGTLGEYTTSGTVVNASLATGLSGPLEIAASGSDLFILNNGNVAEYTTGGALVSAALIAGTPNITGIAVSGGNLFVANQGSYDSHFDYIPFSGSISEYTLAGVPVNTSLVTGLYDPAAIAVSGSNLFVSSDPTFGNTAISEYTTSGSLVNASIVSGLGVSAILVVPAPEPSTWVLLATGTTATLALGRRSRGRKAR